MKDTTVLTYKEVLEKIQDQENHLLIANGFNYGLGVNTGYKAIFQKMAENNFSIYNDALDLVEECGFDLEEFIGKIESDINSENKFLRKYVHNKIKLDFMQATHEIVKSEIKSIYSEKNEGIYLLLRQFNNFFTLNYDSFLYLLLLKYKPIDSDSQNVIAFEPNSLFIEEDLNEKHNDIYKEIKSARENGKLRINFGSGSGVIEKDCNKLTKTHFTAEVREYSRTNEKGWKSKEIDKVVKRIIEEEKRLFILNQIDDGSRQLNLFDDKSDFIFEHRDTQNLFFLHGAFHIFRDGIQIKKITQQSDKALYDKLEDVLNNDKQDVVCVFQHENKTDAINENEYLSGCLNKLGELAGNLVIIGSSLADNDNHIFNKINDSELKSIYISALPEQKDNMTRLANSKLPKKDIYIFDATSISYEMPSGES